MKVRIDVNTMNSGRAQIAMFRDGQTNGFVRTYKSPEEAKKVLFALGLPADKVQETLDLVTQIGPNQPLRVATQDIPDDLLRGHGFNP